MSGDVDSLAHAALRELTGIPGVRRAAIALVEGGGRRLRFRSSDGDAWCHIDAYDDVPLTLVVRTGEPLLADLDDLPARFAGVVASNTMQPTGDHDPGDAFRAWRDYSQTAEEFAIGRIVDGERVKDRIEREFRWSCAEEPGYVPPDAGATE